MQRTSIDGLDGLLSGVVAHGSRLGLLVLSLVLVGHIDANLMSSESRHRWVRLERQPQMDVTLSGVRVVLCLALLGSRAWLPSTQLQPGDDLPG